MDIIITYDKKTKAEKWLETHGLKFTYAKYSVFNLDGSPSTATPEPGCVVIEQENESATTKAQLRVVFNAADDSQALMFKLAL